MVITALPGTEVGGALDAIGADVLGDKVVLDPSAAFTAQMEMAYPGDSVGQQMQTRFPRARIVKTLNTMNFTIMVDSMSSLHAATVFLSGDDVQAKSLVRMLLGDLGWPEQSILDLGGVETALATEHLAPMFIATARALGTRRSTSRCQEGEIGAHYRGEMTRSSSAAERPSLVDRGTRSAGGSP